MSLLDKPFDQLTFEDIEEYCREKHLETATLDYKQEVPRDLSKHIAAMSNTMGGIIIIGVEEDPKTGLPVRWEGVSPADKPVDRVHQFVANVKPYPSCNVRATNEKNGKIFVLVEVLEGDATPYYPVKDMTTVWLRTGNVSTPLKTAERDAIEVMFGKRDRSAAARAQSLQRAEDLFAGELAIQDFRAAVHMGLDVEAPDREKVMFARMQSDIATFTLQPYYPHRELMRAREIKAHHPTLIRRSPRGRSFPNLDLQAGPASLHSADRRLGYVRADQIHANGLLYHRVGDVVRRERDGDLRHLSIERLADSLFVFLKASQAVYRTLNYHGLLRGEVALSDVHGAMIHYIVPPGWTSSDSPSELPMAPLTHYAWPLELDTHKLADDGGMEAYFISVVNRIYWDLGLADDSTAAVKAWLGHYNALVA